MQSRCRCSRVIAALATLSLVPSAALAQIVYSDNFDGNSALNYTITGDPDTLATFAFDYASVGIPAAPNSVGGTTRGLKLEANNGDAVGAAAAINLSPIALSAAGDVIIRFDMWINGNGPFPAGGTGSTQFVTAGVGTSGTTIHKDTGNADGTWFAVDNEGGATQDYRIYLGTVMQLPATGFYSAGAETNARDSQHFYYTTNFPGQAPPEAQLNVHPNQFGFVQNGAVGFAWRRVEISRIGSDVTWSIDGFPIANVPSAVLPGNNIFIGYWDPFASVSDNPVMSFGVIDNLQVSVPEPGSAALMMVGAIGFLARRRRRSLPNCEQFSCV